MNVFSKVTLQGLKRNRTRTAVTIIGVILSASMIMAVTSFISSLQNYLLQTAIVQNGDWHANYLDVDSDFVQKIKEDKDVKKTALIQNFGYALLDGGENTSKPYLFISGFTSEAFETLPINLATGSLPQNAGEIIIPEHVKTQGGVEYNIGDTLTLEVGSRIFDGYKLNRRYPYISASDENPAESFEAEFTKTYTIVGFYNRIANDYYSAPIFIAVTTAEKTAGGSYDVYFKINSVKNIYSFTENYFSDYVNYNREYLRAMGVSNNDTYNTVLYSLGGILIALIMTGSILLIYNSFSISVSERTRQFGILSSVGATKKQLRKSVLFEGFCIGIIGIPIGILAGIGGIGVTLKFVGGIFDSMTTTDVSLTLSVSLAAVIVTVLVGTAVILISAFIPAQRASKRSAIDSIRQTDDVKIRARSVKTSRLTTRLFGLSGMLASKNFKRNRKRYRTTIISLFVSIVLFVSASAFGMYLKQGTEKSFSVSDYDLALNSSFISEDEMLRLYEKLKNIDGIYDSSYQLSTDFTCSLAPGILTEKFLEYFSINDDDPEAGFNMGCSVYFIEDATYLRYLEELGLPADEYTVAKLPAVAKMQGYDSDIKRVISFDIFKQKGNISLTITPYEFIYEEPNTDTGTPVENMDKDVTSTLVDKKPLGFEQSNHSGITIFAPYSIKDQFYLQKDFEKRLTLVFMSKDPMKAAADIGSVIREAGLNHDQYTLYNAAEAQEANRNILLIINVFTYGFIILMSLITVANVFNTISTNINLRRREFAMLRSVGMTDRGFNKMMNYECLLYGVKALLYGLPASIGVTFLIYKGVVSGVDMPFTLPWESIGISVLGVFFVVFVTMMYSVNKLKKENTVDALKNDMM